MTFRLRTVSTTADGRRIVRDKDLAQDRLTLGRSAENDIHLPDLAVEPSHARIAREGDSRIAVEAVGSLGFTLDGQSVRHASIDAQTGAELRFGSSRVSIGAEDDAILLTVEPLADSAEADPERDGLSLASVMPGKRTLAWIFAALIAALFLALPIASNLLRAPDPQTSHVVGDGSWTPGPLSRAHHRLEDKCEACHVKPFESVRNETCVNCHKTVHDHADGARLTLARAEPGPGGRLLAGIAHAFGKEAPGACVDCHREHEGGAAMPPPAQQFCADCHGSLKDRVADTRLGNAADFDTLHPEFSPAVMVDPVAGTTRRTPLGATARENSGLAFPHKLHLDQRGGVAKMAATLAGERGYGANGLACADCHRPTEDGVRFKPITMERDCEACHSLVYDKLGPTYRKLRHGDIDQAIADLQVAGSTTYPLVTGRARPGTYGANQIYFARFTQPVGGGLAAGMLGKDGVCGECHTATMKNGRPAVVPVKLPLRYMANGWFDHSAHKQTKCAECHAAAGSSSSADVLLPRLTECRTCHVGEQETGLFAPRGKVSSGCAMCHAYHPTGSAPPLARRDQR